MKPWSHQINKVLPLVLSLLGALLFADIGDGQPEPSRAGVRGEIQEVTFPVVAVRVSGNRLSGDQLIINESRLKRGRSYSEKELQLALRRVQRLPFVLYAEVSLERGDSYGTFAVRFTIEENKALFFHYDRLDVSRPDPPALMNPEDLTSTSLSDEGLSPAVSQEDDLNRLNFGGRWFLGRFGFVYATTALSNEDGGLDFARGKPIDLGFSHYNLFGAGMFFNLNVQFSQTADFENFDPWTRNDIQVRVDRDPLISLNAALPLRGQHWLTFSGSFLDERQEHLGEEVFVDRIELQRVAFEAGWLREAVNDAVFPTRGRRYLVNLVYIDEDRDFDFVFEGDTRESEGEVGGFPENSFFDSRFGPSGLNSVTGLFLRGAWDHYQPLVWRGLTAYQRASVLAQLDRQGSAFEVPLNFGSAVSLGLTYDLWSARNLRVGDLRLETEATYVHTDLDEDESFLVLDDRYHRLQASLAFRNAWGLIRIGAAYRSDALPVVAQMP